jgi:hypothetical protein
MNDSKTSTAVILSATNLARTGLGLNPEEKSKNLLTIHLAYGTADIYES